MLSSPSQVYLLEDILLVKNEMQSFNIQQHVHWIVYLADFRWFEVAFGSQVLDKLGRRESEAAHYVKVHCYSPRTKPTYTCPSVTSTHTVFSSRC